MYWIALLPSHEEERGAWGWHGLRFTPRVAQVDEAWLLEVAASERLWGGRKRLLRKLLQESQPLALSAWASGATSRVALGLLRWKLGGEAPPARVPDGLPLEVLSEAREHADTLQRLGCRSWGELRALPRAGVARRFGAGLLEALDAAYGERPEQYPWLQWPESFDLKVELPMLATGTAELLPTAHHLLKHLQGWLQARHLGIVALELEWTLDLRRLNGVLLPPHEQLPIRTAQPTQDIAHLRRLLREHLARSSLRAPASHLRLRSLEARPWGGADTSLLPEDRFEGERLHQLVERLSARLGESNVVVPVACEDHRPEHMQTWRAANQPAPRLAANPQVPASHALYPPWLLPRPVLLEIHNNQPHYEGPLRLVSRMQRVETAWWENGRPVVRDYCIASSEAAGLVWVYREQFVRMVAGEPQKQSRWYLQGLYA